MGPIQAGRPQRPSTCSETTTTGCPGVPREVSPLLVYVFLNFVDRVLDPCYRAVLAQASNISYFLSDVIAITRKIL